MHTASVIVAITGIVVVGVLVWITGAVNSHTQRRLLEAQTRDAALVLGGVVPSLEAPMDTSVASLDAGGNAAKVERYVGHDVGTAKGRQFQSFSVWRETAGALTKVFAVGRSEPFSSDPARLAEFFSTIKGSGSMAITGHLTGSHPGLLVAEESISTNPRYIAYAEVPVAPHRRSKPPTTRAFDDLGFAIYLGMHPNQRDLVSTTTALPFTGETSSAVIPFGQGTLLFVDEPTAPLGGGILPILPWIIAVAGGVLVVAAVVMTEWLARRRRFAEELANENHQLYSEQRTISQGLQRALLPQELPAFAGMELAARYVAGDPAADIGGDWYDVIRCDEHSLIFAVGDVSGRGVPAANTMASLHFAIRAYAAQGDSAPVILEKLTSLLDISRDGHFATVLLGHIDVRDHEMTLVSAGHLPPLLVWGGDGDREARFVETLSGSPIGISPMATYESIFVTVPPRARLLAYTDGLVERRGEHLDVGLERLRQTAIALDDTEPDTLGRVVGTLTGAESRDDIAILELRWTN